MFGWFKKVGSWVGKAVGVVERVLSDNHIAIAVKLVTEARDTITDNDARRAFVLSRLAALGISESKARLLIELALSIVKGL